MAKVQKTNNERDDLLGDEEDAGIGHNSVTASGKQILSIIERYERITEEIKELQVDRKEIMAEAKGRGYDTKIMRRVIAERKRDQDDIAEEEAILDLYRAALGMGGYSSGAGDDDEDGDDEGMV